MLNIICLAFEVGGILFMENLNLWYSLFKLHDYSHPPQRCEGAGEYLAVKLLFL